MRALASSALGALGLGFAFAACAPIHADTGRDALLQVRSAQFRRETMPASTSGPKVLSATFPGRARASVAELGASGELESPATAIAVRLRSDPGFWIVPAAPPALGAPTTPTFQLVFGLSAALAPGPQEIEVRAVDGAGRFGPPSASSLEVVNADRPSGRFVVSLSWDDQADLDLHVVLPSGLEIFKRNPTEYQPPPISAGPVPPGTPTDGGVLDRDSNAHCVLDGRRAENVTWDEPPPSGHYIVRVDTFSLCGAVNASWRLEALLDGVRIGSASGVSTDYDVRFEHNRGGGVLALELDVP